MVRIGDDKVVDFVEESLVEELDNVKMWQRRIQTAIEQVLKRRTTPNHNQRHSISD